MDWVLSNLLLGVFSGYVLTSWMGLHTTTPQYDSFSFTLQIHGGLHWVSVLVTPLWTLCRFLQYTIVIVRAYIMARLPDFDVIHGGTSCNQEPPPVNRLSEVQSHHQMSWWPRVFWKWPFYWALHFYQHFIRWWVNFYFYLFWVCFHHLDFLD